MNILSTKRAPKAIGPYSQAVGAAGLVFCSGQLGIKPETGDFAGDDVASQTCQALQNLESVLEAAGLTLNDVVKTTVFLRNMDDFGQMNEAYAEAFGHHKPARAAVEVARLPKDALVEIECIAASQGTF